MIAATETKTCVRCGREFTRQDYESAVRFAQRAYCGKACASAVNVEKSWAKTALRTKHATFQPCPKNEGKAHHWLATRLVAGGTEFACIHCSERRVFPAPEE